MRKIMHNLYSYIFEIFRDTIKFVRERSIFFFQLFDDESIGGFVIIRDD